MESPYEDEMGRLCTAFETMRKTLLENNRELWRQAEERKRLNAAFSHNLRNPITVLKGSIKLAKNSIQGQVQTGQIQDHLIRIEDYIRRIECYIETMSSVQKLEEFPVERTKMEWESLLLQLRLSLIHILADTAIAASAKLAKQLGAFPKCNTEEIMSTPYFLANTTEMTRELVRKYGLRNSQLLTLSLIHI